MTDLIGHASGQSRQQESDMVAEAVPLPREALIPL